MLMPTGRGWEYAVRVSPRGAFGTPAPLDPDVPAAWTPLDLALEGDVFVVDLPDEVAGEVEAYAVSGVYDAFSPDSWRPLSRSPSPWSYSGTEQAVPVIDVLAPSFESQVRSLRDGMLPAASRRAAGGLMWLLLSMAGVLVAATGLWLRRLVRPPVAEGAAEVLEPAEDAEEAVEPATNDAEDASQEEKSEGAVGGFSGFGHGPEDAQEEVEDDMLGFVDRRPWPLRVETTVDDIAVGSADDIAEGPEVDLAEGRGDDLTEGPEDYLSEGHADDLDEPDEADPDDEDSDDEDVGEDRTPGGA